MPISRIRANAPHRRSRPQAPKIAGRPPPPPPLGIAPPFFTNAFECKAQGPRLFCVWTRLVAAPFLWLQPCNRAAFDPPYDPHLGPPRARDRAKCCAMLRYPRGGRRLFLCMQVFAWPAPAGDRLVISCFSPSPPIPTFTNMPRPWGPPKTPNTRGRPLVNTW